MGAMVMDDRIQAIVAGWSEEAVGAQATYIEDELGIESMRVVKFNHEAVMINEALDFADKPYVWYVEPDVDISLYPDCPFLMADWLDENEDAHLIRPNREGEPARPKSFERMYEERLWEAGLMLEVQVEDDTGKLVTSKLFLEQFIYDKYLDDGTAWMFRNQVGVRWDEDFIFSGFGDIDFGMAVVANGGRCVLDTRRSVNKKFTHYGNWNKFRWATVWRNRLLLEVKWFWVGPKEWRGVDWYNDGARPQHRIPTMYELAGYTDEQLELFSQSIDQEHPQIRWPELGHGGNAGWKRPW